MREYAISVKAIVRNGAGEWLVMKRAMGSSNNRGLWDLPGGKLDSGENVGTAIRREVLEETALVIGNFSFLSTVPLRLKERTILYLMFEATCDQDSFALSDEHSDGLFCHPRQLEQRCPGLTPLLAEVIRLYPGWSLD